VPHPGVSKILKELSKRNLDERRALPGIGPRRAEIIIAGAMVFAELMDMCALRNFRYLPLGLRDGLLAQMLADYGDSSAMKERVESERHDALLAVAMNGKPLPVAHGFPARMVVPGLYGYVSATKWVVDLKVTTFAEESAYWTDRGWSAMGPIKTASRIDVPGSFAQVNKGTVAVAGMAWAQHRGIKGVQVQIDDGAWQDATLSGEVSTDTWRQWMYRWDATTTGSHTIRCRAIDETGAVQTDQVQGVMPDGATGWDSRSVTVTA